MKTKICYYLDKIFLIGAATLGKKPTSPDLMTTFIDLVEKTGIAGEPIAENPIWQSRLEKIIDHLPENIASGLIDRLHIAVDDLDANAVNFANIHGLTPAEQKLLVSLTGGFSVPEHAKKLGISVNTGRVHMQRILDKTGASGQLDLMKMLHKR